MLAYPDPFFLSGGLVILLCLNLLIYGCTSILIDSHISAL
jgi:hypothetical protein